MGEGVWMLLAALDAARAGLSSGAPAAALAGASFTKEPGQDRLQLMGLEE